MWVILPNYADWDCFKTPILRETLKTQNLLRGTLCVFGSHTFVPGSWMCKKQTSVSHSSTESEIISLDAGLRLNGLPALYLWDLIVLVLGNTTQNHDRTGQPVVYAHSSSYSDWNIDKTWYSQEWKSDEVMDDRTVDTRCERTAHGPDSLSKTMRRILTLKQNQNCR